MTEVVHVAVWSGAAPHVELREGVTERVGTSPFDGFEATFNVAVPRLEVFVPATPNGTAVLIAPGGGFHQLSMESEGRELARLLAERGAVAAVLAYRLVPTPVDDEGCQAAIFAAFADVQGTVAPYRPAMDADIAEAVRLLRAGIDGTTAPADRLVAIGFSAGAGLVTDLVLGTDPTTRVDAAAVLYLAFLLTETVAVPDDAPPLFVLAAADDMLGVIGNEMIHRSWTEAGRPVEYHLYERGNHGFGTRKQGLPVDRWPEVWCDWLASHGLL